MRFSIVALVTPLLLAGSALAGYNCKCQVGDVQYDSLSEKCCNQLGGFNVYHGDQHHQCSNAFGSLDNGAFVRCCQGNGVSAAFCWT
ncbi:hypothetical protein Q9L58_005360 [Maublancomyces gigas]|uniref:Plethodontid modulating factor n=1 Tax=Discina gigas TaxID=1032678 RepID=A0ABR3GIV4_9PEZI